MKPPGRPLTEAEWRALSPGLAAALRAVKAEPRLIARPHMAARIAAFWRGSVPILTRGPLIWWPGALDCFAQAGHEQAMAVLQHELQHVLDYAAGALTAFGYLIHPRNWTYRWRLDEHARWEDYGAEQRAAMAEHLWRMEHGLADPRGLEKLQDFIPWACKEKRR